MDVGIRSWRRKEWTSFTLIFIFLVLQLLFVGYPIIYSDSSRYIKAASAFTTNIYSLTFVSYLIRPFFILMNVWGFAFFQILILTYVIVSALKFFNRSFFIGIFAIFMSWAGIIAISVLMDIYTAVGLLALFLILSNNRDPVLYVILSICYIAHSGNVVLFPMCAAVYWLLFRRNNFFLLGKLSIIFVIPLLVVSLVNLRIDKKFYFFPKTKNTFLAMIMPPPKIAKSYIKNYPESKLGKRLKGYRNMMEKKKSGKRPNRLWNFSEGVFRNNQEHLEFNSEAKELIFYAARSHPVVLFKSFIHRTFEFLVNPIFMPWKDFVHLYYPKESTYEPMSQMEKTLQYKGKAWFICLGWLYRFFYFFSFGFILCYLAFSVWIPALRRKKHFSFIVFTVFILIFNAFIMSNAAGISYRYQVRVLLLLYLALCLIIFDPGLRTIITNIKNKDASLIK